MIHWDLITPAPNSRVISHCGGTLEDSLRLPCIHPSPPTSPPWPLKHHSPVPPQQSHENTRSSVIHFSLQAPFFYEATSTELHLSGPNGIQRFSNTFGLPSTDMVETSSGQYLWLVWFLFTLWVLGLFSSVGRFFFLVLHHPCNSASLHLQYVRMLAWPCQASAHWCFSELSPQPKERAAPPTSNCLNPLQRQTRTRQLSSNGQRKTGCRPACGFSHSKTHDLSVYVFVYECLLSAWERLWVGERNIEVQTWCLTHERHERKKNPTYNDGRTLFQSTLGQVWSATSRWHDSDKRKTRGKWPRGTLLTAWRYLLFEVAHTFNPSYSYRNPCDRNTTLLLKHQSLLDFV